MTKSQTLELQLLKQCLSNENEAEANGVKYMFMDADTVYRFENNKMKKISKTLLNKAKKQLVDEQERRSIPASQANDDELPNKQRKKVVKRVNGKGKASIIVNESTDDEQQTDDEQTSDDIEPQPQPPIEQPTTKQRKKVVKKPSAANAAVFTPDEFYDTKYKLAYMNDENTRLKDKVNKLKQYKKIVQRINTYGEYGDYEQKNVVEQPLQTNEQQQFQQFQPVKSSVNDSLFIY